MLKIFITYQYFTPAYLAGGPIQSLNNMVRMFDDGNVTLYIFCCNQDIDGKELKVSVDEWVEYTSNAKVFYSSNPSRDIDKALTAISPDLIFINGLFSYPFTLKPLMWNGNTRKILSVRGMLHPGALSQKPFKKNFFIQFFKLIGLHRKCEFHATASDEVGCIKNIFGNGAKVWEAANFPKVLSLQAQPDKNIGVLQLVTVALISPMKNIKLVLEALRKCTSNITYNLYGPVKDPQYWKECLSVINALPSNIKVIYHGALEPEKVEEVLLQAHCFIMPSKSENFGHAIYEALSAGKPAITSHFTPWNELEQNVAGFNIDVNDTSSVTNVIEKVALMNAVEYKSWSIGASAYAAKKIEITSIKKAYNAMFGISA